MSRVIIVTSALGRTGVSTLAAALERNIPGPTRLLDVSGHADYPTTGMRPVKPTVARIEEVNGLAENTAATVIVDGGVYDILEGKLDKVTVPYHLVLMAPNPENVPAFIKCQNLAVEHPEALTVVNLAKPARRGLFDRLKANDFTKPVPVEGTDVTIAAESNSGKRFNTFDDAARTINRLAV